MCGRKLIQTKKKTSNLSLTLSKRVREKDLGVCGSAAANPPHERENTRSSVTTSCLCWLVQSLRPASCCSSLSGFLCIAHCFAVASRYSECTCTARDYRIFVRSTNKMKPCATGVSPLTSPFPRSLHAKISPSSKVTLTSRILTSRKRAKVNERWREPLQGGESPIYPCSQADASLATGALSHLRFLVHLLSPRSAQQQLFSTGR